MSRLTKKKRLGVSHKPECTHYLQLASIYVGYRGFSVQRCISLVLASEKFKREAISLHHHLTQLAFYLGINFIGLNWLEMAPLLNKPNENEVTLRGHKPLEILTQFKKGLDLLMLNIWVCRLKGCKVTSQKTFE